MNKVQILFLCFADTILVLLIKNIFQYPEFLSIFADAALNIEENVVDFSTILLGPTSQHFTVNYQYCKSTVFIVIQLDCL